MTDPLCDFGSEVVSRENSSRQLSDSKRRGRPLRHSNQESIHHMSDHNSAVAT